MTRDDFAAFESLGALVIVLDAAGSVVHWNSACSASTGYSVEEVRGSAFERLFPSPEHQAQLSSLLGGLRGRERSPPLLLEWKSRAGALRGVTLCASRVAGPEGWFVLSGVESSERMEELRASHQGLRTLLELAPDGIFVADLEGRYTEVNEAACRMLGYSREELLAMRIPDLLGAEDVERLWASHREMRGGGVHVADWMLRRKDGTWLPVEVSATILPDGRWQGFVRDVSRRKGLEQALREQHEALKRAQSVGNIGSWRMDLTRNELTWSDECYRMFGIPLGTPMTYDSFLALVHPEDRAFVNAQWAAALRGTSYDFEHRIVVAGQTKWVRERADLDFDERGQLRGGVGVVQDLTDLRRITEEKRLWQARLDAIISTVADAIISVDPQMRIVVYNDGAEAIFGWSRKEILGRELDVLIPQRFREVHRAHIARFATEAVRARRMGDRSEVYGLRKSGEEFPAEAGISKTEVGGGTLFTVTLRDISDRKRIEEALRTSEERLRVSLEAAPIMVFNQDVQLRYTWLHGPHAPIPPGKALGKTDFDLLPRDEAERLTAIKRRVLETGKRARETVRSSAGNGERFYDLTVEPLRDRSGRVIGITCATWDVTAQKRVEDELRFLTEVGSTLMSATPDLEATLTEIGNQVVRGFADWFVLDLVEHGEVRRIRVICANPAQAETAAALERIRLDQRRPQLNSKAILEGQTTLVPAVTPEFLRSISQGEEHLRLLSALGARSLLSVPLVARDRTVGGMALISARPGRRYGERELAFAEQLGRLAALAVDNAQLLDARQRAIAARDEVLGIVAHDLRNPLNVVLIQSQLLQRRAETAMPGAEAGLGNIHRAAVRMNHLVRDMLDVARLDAGSLTLDRAPVGTAALLHEVLESQRVPANRAGVQLRLGLRDHLPDVFADRDRLLQVFENLIGNALKFTPAEGEIVVGAVPSRDAVLFWVSDTGCGIPAELAPHLFDRFWQANRKDRRGAGLGLAIVKGIVEAHGGRIWVRSQVGMGSTFFLTIPTPADAHDARSGALH